MYKRQGQTPLDQPLYEGLVDFRPLTLMIRTVIPPLTVDGRSFVKSDFKIIQHVDDRLHCAFHITLVIRIFDSQKKCAAALVRQSFIDKLSLIHISIIPCSVYRLFAMDGSVSVR